MWGSRLAWKIQPPTAPAIKIKTTIELIMSQPASKRSHAATIEPKMRPVTTSGCIE